jgi:septal ring factor EnvC (AmiA/AmiB activator)
MNDIERVYSDADVTRMILAGVDHPSLPSDYLTSEMARDRMGEIERLRLQISLCNGHDTIAQLQAHIDEQKSEIERLREALREIAERPASISRNIARKALGGQDD